MCVDEWLKGSMLQLGTKLLISKYYVKLPEYESFSYLLTVLKNSMVGLLFLLSNCYICVKFYQYHAPKLDMV